MSAPERWLPVLGYEGFHEVSDQGRVRTVHHVVIKADGRPQTVFQHEMSYSPSHGYPHVHLSRDGRTVNRAVHTLVLEAFVGPRPEGMECCHKDGTRTNNRLSNLRWGTSSENNYDIVEHGTHYNASKTRCPRGHELVAPNLVRSSLANGRRDCRACSRARADAKRTGRPVASLADEKYESLMGAVA